MSVFKPVPREINFASSEKQWIQYWKDNKIFDKQLEQGKARAKTEGKSTFVFYEGPPTANGMPHPGHVLTRVVKDLFPRYKAMQGFDVPRKAGWDTHGLPVEIEVEKQLGIEGKDQIEAYGVEPFVKKCKDSVFKYSDLWAKLTDRIAFWIDMDDPYVTYHQSYIESVWWALKSFWDAGLLYHGSKIVPWCPRCGTALSSHEVGQGYKEVEDPSAYVAFRSKEDPKLLYLAWTTTPWTLLSNVALAIGKDHDYDYVRVGDETLVMASALREKTMGKLEHTVTKTVKGSDLLGLKYEQLFTYGKADKPGFRIVAGDFVGLDTGTGIVHIAPAYGEDDYRVGRENDLPFINLVKPDGTFMDEVEPWKGMFVKKADSLIIKELRSRNQLLKSEQYKHDYPFCWRCPSPLLYYPRPAWYINTSSLKDKMLENNAAITWLPEHIKNGRFGNFLETNIDWALSRERYWGTPLPIWECTSCDHKTAIGSQKELIEKGISVPNDIELHKPYVDEAKVRCEKCGGEMKRVSEVIDCWFDSGSMPFAQWGYPHKDGSAEKLAAAFPADFISEAIDQTRGWFYSLLAIATLLKECGRRKADKGEALGSLKPWYDISYPMPYKKCLVMGHVCDEKGYKMSKSKGNYLDPWTILDKEGSDALRWFFYSSNHPWTSVRFFDSAIRDSQKDFLVRLRNVYSFFIIYANIDGFDPREGVSDPGQLSDFSSAKTYVPLEKRSDLDRWMVSKLNGLIRDVTKHIEDMSILSAAQALHGFVDALSNWFVRRSRDRFWKSEKDTDKWAAYWTLYESLTTLSMLLAPFTPCFSEEMYHGLARELWGDKLPESIHLFRWPTVNESAISPEIEKTMDMIRELASLGLSARAAQKLKVRQPLAQAVVVLSDPSLKDSVVASSSVLEEEMNVKELVYADNADEYVQYIVKPDFKVLGPKLGKNVKACAAALQKAKAFEIVNAVQGGGSFALDLNGEQIVLTEAELDVRIQSKEGFAASGSKAAVVVLDTTVTEALEREGLAREITNRIQGIRKELDLPYEAKIAVRLGAGGTVARAANEFVATISQETLAGDFKTEFEELDETRTFTIGDEEVRVSVKVIG